MATETWSLLHLHLSVPPPKLGAAGFKPESTAGCIERGTTISFSLAWADYAGSYV
jgi:hypothetical protein